MNYFQTHHIKFMKCTTKKCLDNNDDINLALLQKRTTLIGTGLPSPATPLFNRPEHQINREPINFNADDDLYKAQNIHQDKYMKGNDTHRLIFFPCRVYSSCPAQRWWTLDTQHSGRDEQH